MIVIFSKDIVEFELQIWKNGPTFDENYNEALSLKYLDVSKNLGMSFVDLDDNRRGK